MTLRGLANSLTYTPGPFAPLCPLSPVYLDYLFLSPLIPIHNKVLQRLTGVFVWCGRPLTGANVFLQPLYFQLVRSAPRLNRRFHYASNRTCRTTFDFAAVACLGWQAVTLVPYHDPDPSCLVFVDAAAVGEFFHIGVFPPTRGIQVCIAPPRGVDRRGN